MARSIMWVQQKKFREHVKFASKESEIKFAFSTNLIGIRLLLFNIESVKSLASKKFLNEVEKSYCVPDEEFIFSFITQLKNLDK